MMNNFIDFPSQKFTDTITQSCQTLEMIGMGVLGGWAFDKMRNNLKFCLINKRPLDKANTIKDSLLALSVFIQDDELWKLLTNRFYDMKYLIQPFLLEDDARLLKRMLRLYFHRYFFFENNETYFLQELKKLLEADKGEIRFIGEVKKASFLFSTLAEHLKNKPIEYWQECKEKFLLQDNDEILVYIRLTLWLNEVEKWSLEDIENIKNEEELPLLNNIKPYHHYKANDERNIIEEVIKIILEKFYKKQKPNDFWINYIFANIGDPRSSKLEIKQKWLRIGEKLYLWLRSLLSQDDVREFLENLTDNKGDEIWQYRRQFWLQYIDYVQFAKIILCKNDWNNLKENNPDFYERHIKSPETYSSLSNSNNRSCIYMDFGTIKVIEGTHSTMLRLYKKEPIELSDKDYCYEEFYNYPKAKEVLIEEIVHSKSEYNYYTWQNKVRYRLNKKIEANVKIEEVILEEDKYRIGDIKNHLFMTQPDYPVFE